jgi:hypothetical protein
MAAPSFKNTVVDRSLSNTRLHLTALRESLLNAARGEPV